MNVHAKYELYTGDMFEVLRPFSFFHLTQVDHPEKYDGASSST